MYWRRSDMGRNPHDPLGGWVVGAQGLRADRSFPAEGACYTRASIENMRAAISERGVTRMVNLVTIPVTAISPTSPAAPAISLVAGRRANCTTMLRWTLLCELTGFCRQVRSQ